MRVKHSKDTLFLTLSRPLQCQRIQRHSDDTLYCKQCNDNLSYHQSYLKRLIWLYVVFGVVILINFILFSKAQAASGIDVGQRILKIELTPALCSMDVSRSRLRQCLEGYSLTVSGLDLGYGEACGKKSLPSLTPLQLHVVNKVMPDMTVRNRAWQTYGVCSPMSSSMYFRQIVNHAGQLKLPRELNNGNSYRVSKSRFLQQITHLNSDLSTTGIDLICRTNQRHQMVLTEIHICYQGTNFASCPKLVNNCGKNFIISGR